MKVLVTGATGFAGRWLLGELAMAGHETVAAPASEVLDVTDAGAVARLIRDVRPDAIAHLAAVSSGPAAGADPERALRTAIVGTQAIFEGVRAAGLRSAVLVSGSSEVYGHPEPSDLPLAEHAPLRATRPYGVIKLAQEGVALASGARYRIPVVVTRSFNHIGPGQRPMFVIPAFVGRVHAFRDGIAPDIPVGNLDVRRDLTDVRDVARAYRLLLEGVAAGLDTPLVVNIASGHSTAIRDVLELLCQIAGIEAKARVDAAFVRPGEPAEIVGSSAFLESLTGWRPEFPLEQTLEDVFADVQSPTAAA
jgi:GDP-4-dehydro-6-deoxy-D-mannose reductase